MGSANLITIIATIIVSLTLSTTVAPTLMKQNESIKVDTEIVQKQKVLFDAISKYTFLEGSIPTSMTDLNTKGYFQDSNNNNGFGGTFTFIIDSAKGTVKITTNIMDVNIRNTFINSNKNSAKPIQSTGDNVDTTFILPLGILSNDNTKSNNILVQDSTPDATTNKYWYDTSSGTSILKISDGINWKTISKPTQNIIQSNNNPLLSIDNKTSTLTTGTNGDTKYIYDNASNTIQQYTYYNGSWFVGTTNTIKKLILFFKFITINKGTACGVDSMDKTYCWGYNNSGQVGDGTTTNKFIPTLINELPFKSFSTGNYNNYFTTCGIDSNDKGYCWGANLYGQVGDGTTQFKYVPTIIPGGLTWKSLSTNGTTCGIDSNNQAYCWGNNSSGQVGDGTTINKLVPIKIGTSTWKLISNSNGTTCGIDSNDKLYCWGNNSNGQVGTQTYGNQITPGLVAASLKWKFVQSGQQITCGIDSNDKGYCWGTNAMGSLGNNLSNDSGIPSPIFGNLNWKSIIPSLSYTTCGIDSNDKGYCWGSNSDGAVGNNLQNINQRTPALVSNTLTWKLITIGDYNYASTTCGIDSNDKAYCWGYNGNGEIGDGTTINKYVPTPVSGGLTFKSLTTKSGTTCGITLDNKSYCWGYNGDGTIGDGTFVNKSIPTLN